MTRRRKTLRDLVEMYRHTQLREGREWEEIGKTYLRAIRRVYNTRHVCAFMEDELV